MSLLIINIKLLAGIQETSSVLRGKALASLSSISNGFLLIEDGLIADFGHMYELEIKIPVLPPEIFDAQEYTLLPCWCDSHSHVVFGKSREDEFVQKLQGMSYADIAAKGGGILNSARVLNEMDEAVLFAEAKKRIDDLISMGTGALEIKSGYGLTIEGELKMLRVIKRLQSECPIIIRATFLGAHAYPLEFRNDHEGYINMVINQMLPVIKEEGLAEFIDVFCEEGFFTPDETERICNAGIAAGLRPKLHVNQLNSIGGMQTAVKLNALSADHLEVMTDEDIAALAQSYTIGTLLPTAAFFLRLPFQPARKLIDEGCAIALASDFNPGSSPSGNMNLVVSLSCIQMKMLPEEAINAATINGAYAMGIGDKAGSITTGKYANIMFFKNLPSLSYLPYAFGSRLVNKVMINGRFFTSDNQ